MEILSSAAGVRPAALVQLDPLSIRAHLKAQLAGDPPTADPNTQGQINSMASVPRESDPAAAAEGFWIQLQDPETFDRSPL